MTIVEFFLRMFCKISKFIKNINKNKKKKLIKSKNYLDNLCSVIPSLNNGSIKLVHFKVYTYIILYYYPKHHEMT